jgi:hypothetical protein
MTEEMRQLWIIYDNPPDFPGYFVARLWRGEEPSHQYVLGLTLDEVRAKLPQGLKWVDRAPDDDPCIVEKWL